MTGTLGSSLARWSNEGLPPLPDVPEVKKELPLEWVIQEEWGILNAGYKKVRCPNPEHRDSEASFNLWAPSGGVFTKFGCYGCGIRGDVFDVIQISRQVDFVSAVHIAASELLPKYRASGYRPTVDDRPEASPEEVEQRYQELTANLPIDRAKLVEFLIHKSLLDLTDYVEQEWNWRGHNLIRAVSIPHYGPDFILTGVKLRSPVDMTSKWGIRGSRYPYLYGTWRDRQSRNVILCEGETDTVYAAWQMRGRDVDILGLPTGARQRATEEQLRQLENRRVWIIFDGDDAGREAAQMWHELVDSSRIVDLPDDIDICKSPASLVDLLGLKGRVNGEE